MAQKAAERPPEETLLLWKREQARLRARVVDRDTEAWQRDPGFSGLRRVGGADVSFVKGDSASACASLVVLSFPELQVVYEESRMVRLTAPYVSGFLAFREAPFLVAAVQRLREKQPDLMPQVLLVDGNGVLHHQGFGVACHLGVLTDLPCIGVAKKLLQVDGLEKDAAHKEQIQLLQAGGEAFPLIGGSGTVLGMALRSHDRSTRPVYVSVGHKVSLETAVRLTRHCCRFRVPEPVRQADIRSREHIRRTLGPPGLPAPAPAPAQGRVTAQRPQTHRTGSPGEPAGEDGAPQHRPKAPPPGPGSGGTGRREDPATPLLSQDSAPGLVPGDGGGLPCTQEELPAPETADHAALGKQQAQPCSL